MPVTSTEIQKHLRELYSRDSDAQLSRFVIRHLADPVRPEDGKGHFRLNGVIVWLGGFGVCAAGTFIYFAYIQP